MGTQLFFNSCTNKMLVHSRAQVPFFRHDEANRWSSSFSSSSVALGKGLDIATSIDSSALSHQGAKERIRKLLYDVDFSISSYDTAWVAMVPSLDSSQVPLFPKCLDWLLNNQLLDGSWSRPHHHPLLIKDALSSTLASVLALKRWGIGEQLVEKGLHFIESHFGSITEENQLSPIGFNIIFTGMLAYARDFDLNIRLESSMLDVLLHKRHLELKRCCESGSQESDAFLAYVSEGLFKLQNWDMVMKWQRKNGSLFNSPSTTAAALMHVKNSDCVSYLDWVLKKFGDAVPAVYPMNVYARLCLIDNIERLGLCRHFREDIQNVLNETYRLWVQGEEEVLKETSTCAIAFRLLRKHGYDVSLDPLDQLIKEERLTNSFGRYSEDINAMLELYQASEMIIHQNESSLEKLNLWSKELMEKRISTGCHSGTITGQIDNKLDDALKFPCHATLQRITNRRTIEHYNTENTRILKTSYCSSNFSNKDLLTLAVEDFNNCQLIHLEELKQLERWVMENRLDKLKFARQKCAYCYFSAAATIYAPELSDARISWAKNGILTTVVDDFFDVGGSVEELKNLILLFEKWDDVSPIKDCCSEQVEIIFSALRSSILEIGDRAFGWQARNVTGHIIEIWLDLLNSMLKEAEWARGISVPTMDEYMSNGYVSFALGPIVLPTLYFVGPKLAEDVIRHPEYHSLFKTLSTFGRLLNDIQSFERESNAGKLNALSLYMIHSDGDITETSAIEHMKSLIENQKREVLRLVLQNEGSVIPRACKDVFWNMARVLIQFYKKNDGFTSHEMMGLVRSIMYEPLPLTTSKEEAARSWKLYFTTS
ncbi:hypothetical protein M9H77_06258 [Catharanthus roseus]|uniref:Uncharacterized protein n=1 Tax=Catharanthus roseus TaxID=4058 RepID=A0ACC0BRM1_CATRO|nr:hypothetical protein M9H77_06258 [Catharanthus roseus]